MPPIPIERGWLDYSKQLKALMKKKENENKKVHEC